VCNLGTDGNSVWRQMNQRKVYE